jgi:hypothetical protein
MPVKNKIDRPVIGPFLLQCLFYFPEIILLCGSLAGGKHQQ